MQNDLRVQTIVVATAECQGESIEISHNVFENKPIIDYAQQRSLNENLMIDDHLKIAEQSNMNPIDDDGGNDESHLSTKGTRKPRLKKQYKCDECGIDFPREWDLKKHYGTHIREKPFECWLCHKL